MSRTPNRRIDQPSIPPCSPDPSQNDPPLHRPSLASLISDDDESSQSSTHSSPLDPSNPEASDDERVSSSSSQSNFWDTVWLNRHFKKIPGHGKQPPPPSWRTSSVKVNEWRTLSERDQHNI